MMIRWRRFNIYLFSILGLALVSGCSSTAGKKIDASLRLHQEMNADPAGRTATIEIFRAQPFNITIEKGAFLTESAVKEAKVVDTVGGFSLQIQFDRHGTWLLEQYTAALRGKHIAIFSQFVPPGTKKPGPGRWLAAPLVSQRVTNGLLVFTPDASREEAEQIAVGLKHVAKKMQSPEPN